MTVVRVGFTATVETALLLKLLDTEDMSRANSTVSGYLLSIKAVSYARISVVTVLTFPHLYTNVLLLCIFDRLIRSSVELRQVKGLVLIQFAGGQLI